ncbi:MAG TPA: cupin domain-containing protein [Polyangiaceae bacterium]|jgi:anti-sigma factor ChrR (cupin superfamily)
MSSDDGLPAFLRDSLNGAEASLSDAEARELLGRVPSLLEPERAGDAGRRRLLDAVNEAPHRYAPFFGRVARLFDISEAATEEIFTRLKHPRSWRMSGLYGVRTLDVAAGPSTEGAQTVLVRFAPGARFPVHRHQGNERVLVLEGSYTDDAGVVYSSGSLHEMTAGSEHGFVVSREGPCIAAAVVHGRLHFKAWPLRLLARLTGR